MFDLFHEILSTLSKNKTRAIMTSFSIGWGILMLILLLGAGKGLQNGMENNYRSSSKNALWIRSGRTQVAHEGLKAGRYIRFNDEDMEALNREFEDIIENSSGRFRVGYEASISYENEYGNYFIEGVLPEFNKIQFFKQMEGRYINQIDNDEFRKVIVISTSIKKTLFKDEEAIGKYVRVRGVPFMVVGIIEDIRNRDRELTFLPLSTSKRVFNGSNRLNEMAIVTNAKTVEENKKIEESIIKTLSERHRISLEDTKALRISNKLEQFKQTQGISAGIRVFIWVIGIMTIVAGVVGVSNIMIILVKERTKEIGIRKAIGATPWSVIRLILSESTFITILAGFFGLVLGMLMLAGASAFIENIAKDSQGIENAFYNPSADVSVALWALLVLVVSGIIAGYIPARKAAAIKPIEALHDE